MNDDGKLARQMRAAGRQLREKLRAIEVSLDTTPEPDKPYSRVRDAVEELLDVCRSTGLVGAANRAPSGEMWAEAGDVLGRGWMLERARHTPRGYAGDYELLGRMYENRHCDDPVGTLLDRYSQYRRAGFFLPHESWVADGRTSPALRS